VVKRWQPLREAVTSPDGRIAASKVIALATQIVVLAHVAYRFGDLINRWEALLVCLTILVAPDTAKKVIAMRYGNGSR
jgi:hypothetical protein